MVAGNPKIPNKNLGHLNTEHQQVFCTNLYALFPWHESPLVLLFSLLCVSPLVLLLSLLFCILFDPDLLLRSALLLSLLSAFCWLNHFNLDLGLLLRIKAANGFGFPFGFPLPPKKRLQTQKKTHPSCSSICQSSSFCGRHLRRLSSMPRVGLTRVARSWRTLCFAHPYTSLVNFCGNWSEGYMQNRASLNFVMGSMEEMPAVET